MSTKHTPGPWRIWTSNSFRRISSDATGKDGDVLHASVHRSDGHPDLQFPNGGFTGPDALLIVAAPELLEALQDICNEQDERQGYASCEAYDKARAAIAKATGEPQ